MSIVSERNIPSRLDNWLIYYLQDNTGNTNAIGDYSQAPVTFFAQPPIGETWYISSGTVHMRCAHGTDLFEPQNYGSGPYLPNGIQLKIVDASSGNTILDFTKGRNIHRNMHWFHFADQYEKSTTHGGQEFLNIKWHMFRESGRYIKLTHNERLEIIVNDDINGLLQSHRFIIQGFIKD